MNEPEGADGTDVRHESFRIEEHPDDRLDRYLADRLRLSRSRVVDLLQDGHVRVNDEVPRKSYRPEPGDRVEVEIVPRPEPSVEPQAIPVDVVWEDEHLAVVVKPAGMVVHPGPGHSDGTLVNALMARLDRLSPIGGDTRPGIVPLLSLFPLFLLFFSPPSLSPLSLSLSLARHEVRRGYLAAAWGHLDADDETVDAPLGRDPSDRTRRAVVEGGKRAVTHLRRLERWRSADLLAVRLETGRTHQIRVHLRHLGHPVVGDATYAENWEKGFLGAGGRWAEELAARCDRMFLHAARLAFRHPATEERMTFTSELPAPRAKAVEWARATSGGAGPGEAEA
jgi:23S rRNA pseudouridine1911/1915/1917 synthase